MSLALQFFLFAFLDRDHEYEGEPNEHTHASMNAGAAIRIYTQTSMHAHTHSNTRNTKWNHRTNDKKNMFNICAVRYRHFLGDLSIRCEKDERRVIPLMPGLLDNFSCIVDGHVMI